MSKNNKKVSGFRVPRSVSDVILLTKKAPLKRFSSDSWYLNGFPVPEKIARVLEAVSSAELLRPTGRPDSWGRQSYRVVLGGRTRKQVTKDLVPFVGRGSSVPKLVSALMRAATPKEKLGGRPSHSVGGVPIPEVPESALPVEEEPSEGKCCMAPGNPGYRCLTGHEA